MELITLPKGQYRDILTDANDQILYDSGWHNNLIVNNGRTLLAGLMKNDSFTGIHYLAVGQGEDSWDTTPSSPTPEVFELVNPHEPPIYDLDLVYLDNDNAITTDRTHRLQITAKFAEGYPTPIAPLNTYPLREFGLFGVLDSGTETTPYLINNVRHPVIHKDETATLTRIIRLHF